MSENEAKYIAEGSNNLSGLLIEFISCSSDAAAIYKAINESIKHLNSELIKDSNPERYRILLEKNFADMILYTFDVSHRRKKLSLLYSTLSLLVTVTNNSDDFTTKLLKSNLPDLLIIDTIKLSTNKRQDSGINMFLCLYLSVTFNILRNPEFREYYTRHNQIDNFKDGVLSCIKIKFENMKVTSIMIMALLIEEDDKQIKALLKHVNVVKKVFKYLLNATKRKNKSYKGFDTWELMIVLRRLSTINFMKKLMIGMSHFVQTIVKITSAFPGTKEAAVALEILKSLGIDESKRDELREKDKIEAIFDKLPMDFFHGTVDSEELAPKLKLPKPLLRSSSDICALDSGRSVTNSVTMRRDLYSMKLTKKTPFTPFQNKIEKFENPRISNLLATPGLRKADYDTVGRWSDDRVYQWLADYHLSDIGNKLIGLDRGMLLTIKDLKKKSPKVYYKHLETSLELSFLEILRFDNALEKLNS